MGKGTLLVVVGLLSLHDPCGSSGVPEGLNGACTRSNDCEPGLSCVGGVCSPEDAQASDGGGDASSDAGAVDGNAAD